MDKPISRFELLIAFGNCLIWLVAAFALSRKFRENRQLREEELEYQLVAQEVRKWANAQLAMMAEEDAAEAAAEEENDMLWEQHWKSCRPPDGQNENVG
ncbi:hypothetical protein PV11_07579 [Exophiala sideris]|uniref:Uncharacterized protein n=1 Tax=Exophiala sideris TaxID=1016849 RepID=A0A0D1YGJ0_9EURO|nr:hypothetical protein PV11_07579 [Exophiala sideris]